jgi:NAD-dependent deacetylase
MGKVGRFDAFAPLAVGEGQRVFVLTGAGISAESGIRTFRDAGGLWEQHRVEEVASPEGWRADPLLVWRFYSERRVQAAACAPNPAHRALASLEERLGDRLYLCTQNVDPLHERAGSQRVVHMHGELFKTRCEACDRAPFHDESTYTDRLPVCACGGRLRPHICWFGEVPFETHFIGRALDACDLFVAVGSSGAVYPAAGYAHRVTHRTWDPDKGPARTVYVGPEEPDNAEAFDECRLGMAGEALPGLFAG